MSTFQKNALSAVSVKNLTVKFGNQLVLNTMTFDIPSGVTVAVLGPNGAGKTTLIKAMLGLVKSSRDSILFFQSSLEKFRTKIAYIPQRDSVDWDFPIVVRDLVMMGRYGNIGLCCRPSKNDEDRVDHYLDLLGMSAFAERQISQLSGGQQQRVFIARALCQEAEIYLMDEPFANVDAATERVIVDLWTLLKKEGKTVLAVHHDLNTVTQYFDEVIMLNVKMVAAGPTSTVYTIENLSKTFEKDFSFFQTFTKLAMRSRSV